MRPLPVIIEKRMFDNVRADLQHYSRLVCRHKPIWRVWPRILLAHPAAAAVIWYRVGRFAWTLRLPVVKQLLQVVYLLFMPVVRLYAGVQIQPQTKVGPGLAIMHFGGVVITPECEIGRNALIYHNVSFVTMRNRQGPRAGDNLYVGTGTTIIGDVVIEDDVTIGAGSIVAQNLPQDGVVAGVPARFLRWRESGEWPTDNKTLRPKPPKWLKVPEDKQRQASREVPSDGTSSGPNGSSATGATQPRQVSRA